MKKLYLIVLCFAAFGLNCAVAQPLNIDTALNDDNFGQNNNYLQSYKRDIVSPAVAAQLQQNISENSLFKIRLDSMQKDIQLDYNDFVQSYINQYTSPGRKGEMARIMGLAKYYFPIYEKAFRDAGIPEEIKYLSIVESALNPNAVSRVGATGPWQFMSSTAKMYGLNMDNYVDERRDPIQASYAAAAYLKDAYQEFGDWLLAIASYNCGKSSVERAMEEANATDYWSVRQYLPAETRNYVPAFIAMNYVMKYHDLHGITPQACNMSLNTDTVLVNKFVSINNIARVLNIDANDLAMLNPAYTQRIVNGTPKAPRRMVIPQLGKEKYNALYEALNTDGPVTKSTPAVYAVANTANPAATATRMPAYHTVKKGETLSSIADKYGVDLEDLRIWNNIRSNKAIPGQRLKVSLGNGKDLVTYNQNTKTTNALN